MHSNLLLDNQIEKEQTKKINYIQKKLQLILSNNGASISEIVCLCIGTDRSTGDALGPLTGSQLLQLLPEKITVLGTVEHPVHATNLSDTLDEIQRSIENPFIIAIDACLGKSSNIGKIIVEDGPVKPGAAVNKDLNPVGSCHITGIVNVNGFMEHSVLQSTRLHRVLSLSTIICHGLNFAIKDYINSYNTIGV